MGSIQDDTANKQLTALSKVPTAPSTVERRRRRWRPEDDPEGTGYMHRVDEPAPAAGRLAAKYALIEVPNWNRATAEADQMGTYLRLGSVPDPSIAGAADAPPATGEDLAAYATTFLDDDRKRDGCPNFVSVADRKAETARLHTKGGWRDHSDGNRVTTTRGDKVEVIRGNYQLVVLGRQDDASGEAGWDVSGGHIEGVGGKSSIEWRQTFGGTWKTFEASEKGDTDVTQHGNNVVRNYGEIQDTTTGSEDETRPSWDADGNPVRVSAPNPVITDRTWARRIASYTGSSGRRVPHVVNESYAEAMSSVTNVHSMTDETHVRDTMSSTTIAGALSNVTIAGQMSNVNLAANTTNLNLGVMENVNVGAMLDVTIAAMLQICASASLSINLGPRAEYNLSQRHELTADREDVAGQLKRTSTSELIKTGNLTVEATLIKLGV